MDWNMMQELEDEEGGRYGDPRRCSVHPSEVTSSPDGMFDAPCGYCEAAMETDEGYERDLEAMRAEHKANLKPVVGNDDIPF